VAGEHYSIADITALVTVDFAAKAINFPLPDEHEATEALVRAGIQASERICLGWTGAPHSDFPLCSAIN